MAWQNFMLLTFSISISSIVTALDSYDLTKLKSIQLLSPETFYSFINTTDVRPVFFYTSQTTDKHHRFYQEYNASAVVLKKFNMDVGIVNCVKYGKEIPLCEAEAVHKDIYVFKQFEVLLKLSLDTMFDVDSIVSNLLQLLYLNEIPIIQTEDEREEFEKNNLGKMSIVFCQIRAMGTHEHRVFLEIAHEFLNKYIFAVSTTTDGASGLSDYEMTEKITRAKLWFIDCLRPDNPGPGCLSVRYRNTISTDQIREFIILLENPFKFDVPDDGLIPVYQEQPIHIAYLIYNAKCWPKVNKEAKRLSQIYHGAIGIVTVNQDKVNAKDQIKLDLKDQEAPIFIMKLLGKVPVMMTHMFLPENIDVFVKKQLRVVERESTKEREKRENVSVVGDNEFDDSVLAPDDEVAESIRTLKTAPNTTLIQVLTDKSFYTVRKESQAMLVLFYMKFDPVSITFLHMYAESSHSHPFENGLPLTMIECFDWTDVCQKENVTSYPTIRVYKPFSHKTYDGPLHGQSVLNFFRLHYVNNPIQLDSIENAEEFLKGIYPSPTQSVVDIIGLAGLNSKSDQVAIFKDLADSVHGEYLLAIVYDEIAEKLCQKYTSPVPCVIVANKRDLIRPVHVYQGLFSKTKLLEYIRSLRTATFIELTDLNFPSYYQQKRPLVILFVDPEHHTTVYENVKSLAAEYTFTKLLFSWMNVAAVDSLGASILAMYTQTPIVPALVYVDLVKAEVYLHNRKSFAKNSLSQWLSNIENGNLIPDHVLPRREWKPVKSGYDFSQGLPREVLEDEEDIKMIVNEYGLGFDAEGQPLKEDGGEEQFRRQTGSSKKKKSKPESMSVMAGMKDEL